MKIKILPPEINDYPRTNLTAKALAGATVVNVKNPSGFTTGDLIVFGEPGEDGAEIKQFSGSGADTLTVTPALAMSHSESTKLQVIQYDYVKILRASSIDGTYVEVASLEIAIDEQVTIYEDPAALDTQYFKIQYVNSATGDVSAESDPIGATGFGRASLASIIERVFTDFGDTARKFLTAEMITEWANEAKDTLANMIAESNENYFLERAELQLDGTGENDVPENFKKVKKLKISYDGTESNSRRARHVDIDELSDELMQYDQNSPIWYFNNFKLCFRPKGTSAGKAFLDFESHPADMEDDSDTLPKPIDRYVGVVVDYCLSRAYERDKKFTVAERFLGRFERAGETMIEHINNIALDQNRTVRDNEVE